MYQVRVGARDDNPVDPLVVLFRREIATRGLASASVRQAAANGGASPAAVNHRFGGKEGIARAALSHALEDDVAQFGRILDELEMTAGRVEPASALHAIVRVLFADSAETALVRWTCLNRCERDGSYGEHARDWIAHVNAFWSGATARLGLPAQHAFFIGAALESFGRAYQMTRYPVLFDGWCGDLCRRLVERATGSAPSINAEKSWREPLMRAVAASCPDAAPMNARQREIVEAAAAILKREGPSALNHRAVAAEAGVSLSSTTHHFRSLKDILLSAYRLIIERATVDARHAGVFDETDYAVSRLVDVLVSGADGVGLETRVSMQEMDHKAANDPELKPMADQLIVRFGETSFRMLSGLKSARKDIDPLDGVLWRSFLITLYQAAAAQEEAREAFIAGAVERCARTLFSEADDGRRGGMRR